MHDLPLRTSLVVSAEGASARTARAAVHDLCAHAAVGPDAADVAALLVSELVSNAHEHARCPAVVDVVVDDRSLRVAVEDENPTLPAARDIDVDAERPRADAGGRPRLALGRGAHRPRQVGLVRARPRLIPPGRPLPPGRPRTYRSRIKWGREIG